MEVCKAAQYHSDPNELVTVGETVVGKFTDDEGRPQPSRRTEKKVKYKDWESRCRICYPG